MNIFYAGNKLSSHNGSVTNIETLSVQLESLGYTVKSVSNKKNKILRLIDMVWSLHRARKRVDLVLIDTYSTSGFWYAVILSAFCKWYGKPYFPILHGGQLPDRLKNSPKLSHYLFSGSKMNIAPSRSFEQLFINEGLPVVLIPNNINISHYKFKERTHHSFRLLWVRSFHAIYNPYIAIELTRKLIDSGYEAQLCMVGPDKDGTMEECKVYAREIGVKANVQFTGMLSKANWHKLAEEYDVFINTTNIDNTPVSVIEAMALGIPVVSTNVGGIPYLLSHGQDALLVPPRDVNELFNAVVETCEFPNETQRRVIAARKKVENYDWEVVKNEWMALFNHVITND
jgi:glycosyltransferase involved in cell wall biosynthesis